MSPAPPPVVLEFGNGEVPVDPMLDLYTPAGEVVPFWKVLSVNDWVGVKVPDFWLAAWSGVVPGAGVVTELWVPAATMNGGDWANIPGLWDSAPPTASRLI